MFPPDTDSSISSSELGSLGSLSLSVVEGTVISGECVLVDGTVVSGIIVVEGSKVVSGMLVVDGAVVSDANVLVSNVFFLSFLLLPPDTDSSISSSELGTLGSLSLSVVEGTVISE